MTSEAVAHDPTSAASDGQRDVQVLVAHAEEAARLLASQNPTGAAEAHERLRVVEHLLGRLIADPTPPAEAATALSLRSNLSVHLSAAGTLSALDLPERSSTVLFRAADGLRRGLDELLRRHGGVTRS